MALATKNRPIIGEWIEETGFHQAIAVTEQSPLFSKRSKYQSIEVHRSKFFGNILVLDGVIQLTERDAAAYNEMMAHIPMFQHTNPKRVLIIGGGDGYVLQEVLKHKSVEKVDHVDLDGEVVTTCREFFSWGKAWEDPRVTLHIDDGAAFAQKAADASYDVVIQDSSDPTTWDEASGAVIPLPSMVLYTEEHFANIHRILSPSGLFTLQAETFSIPSDLEGIVNWRLQARGVGFKESRYGSIFIGSYPTGQIGFLLCEKDPSVASQLADIERRYNKMVQIPTSATDYYQPKLQKSSFDLPLWVEKKIYGSGSSLTMNGVCEAEATNV